MSSDSIFDKMEKELKEKIKHCGVCNIEPCCECMDIEITLRNAREESDKLIPDCGVCKHADKDIDYPLCLNCEVRRRLIG